MNDLSGRDGTLTRPDYRSRVVDSRLSKLLKAFGAVEIVGPKWCGKTWTALSRSRSVDRLDDVAVFAAAQTDPALVLIGGGAPSGGRMARCTANLGCRSSPYR